MSLTTKEILHPKGHPPFEIESVCIITYRYEVDFQLSFELFSPGEGNLSLRSVSTIFVIQI